MSTIYNIIQEINQENGSKYKMEVLKKYKDNDLLQRVLKMAYDKVTFTYGIKKIPEKGDRLPTPCNLEEALTWLETELCTRNQTGNEAIDSLSMLLASLTPESAEIIVKVIDRNLKINMGRSNINKVFNNLIIKPPYQRCDIGTKKNVAKLNFEEGVLSQIKMDGQYRSNTIDGSNIIIMSRSGNESNYPIIQQEIQNLNIDKSVVLVGEFTVDGVSNRAEANGLINSLDKGSKTHDPDWINERLRLTVWDMIDTSEYNQKNGTSLYKDRFNELTKLVENSDRINIVETKIVYSMKEAFEHFQEATARGEEGTVIKSQTMKWKDGTSKEQLKVKLCIDADVRIIGFTDGTVGSKREGKVGAIVFETDDKQVKGRTSGFSDDFLDEITNNKEKYLRKIMVVQFNDLTQASGNDYYALGHPRFIEVREDKDETDTLERLFELREMAMNLV